MGQAIHIDFVTKRFGKTVAVDKVDLKIDAGELFFLLGPSGCGKTTLLRMLAGFTEPTAGVLRFGDRDVTNLPANKRNCGMVFQGYALWPHMTVAQNVAFGLDVRKVSAAEKKKLVQQALDLVQLGPLGDRKPNQLSGGQQQRVALARALVIEPDVLLLDEPLSNLDAKLRNDMRSQIREICKRAGTTGVYVTHDQKEALSMADRLAVLRDGKVEQVGTPREVYERPINRFVADFLGETNFVAAEVLGVDADAGTPTMRLSSALGPLRSAAFPPDIAEGSKVTCSIRPEAIRLVHREEVGAQMGQATGGTPAPPESDDAIALGENIASVDRASEVYLGEVAQHQLVADGSTLRAFELNPKPLADFGGKVHITFDASDVVVLCD